MVGCDGVGLCCKKMVVVGWEVYGGCRSWRWTKVSGLGEVVERDCQACKLNKEDAMDCKRWRKQVRDD